jgi:4-hydroxyphenylpyruvate dioxygenase-like putative hemolysin
MAAHDIAYVELYTRDKATTVEYFVSAMGFSRVADSVEPERSSVLLQQGEVRLVVTSGRGVARFLEQHGDGIADVALTCDDVAATAVAAASAGATVQVCTRSPYPRNTLYFEFVQRNGSRGFGSANIRALYETVQSDRLAS